VAGYKSSFDANVDYAYGRGINDITSRLNQGMSSLSGLGRGIGAFVGQFASARRATKDLANTMNDLKVDIEAATDPREIRRLVREFERARTSAEKFKKQLIQVPLGAVESGLKKLVDTLLSLNTAVLSISFDFLVDSIKRVYELQERWTQAIGGFNMKLGAMTKGIESAQKEAIKWSSTIRGLTGGDIQEGMQMFGEFTMAMGRTVKAGEGFSKLGLVLSRGFGLGSSGSGTLLKVFENIGMSVDDATEAVKVSIKAANQADIPVNMLADDLAKSATYMARFGKEGQKTLVQGAAWARKYDISLEQLRATVESFDMFDDAAKKASKLNAAFGTMINSMDLMMEDDPAARLDMIRQQMLAQGWTYDSLTPKQRRHFSTILQLTEEQTAALLDSRNANESYTDFVAKAEAKQKRELKAKEMMQRMLQKTAQTMFSFADAFDRVTRAIAKAISPLLRVLGLAKEGGKDFSSFGDVMKEITSTVVHFFESLAERPRWRSFMEELGKDLQRAGTALKEFVMSGRAADWVGDIAKSMKSFYVTVRDLVIKLAPFFKSFVDLMFRLSGHIKEIAIAWAGLKVFNMVGGMGAFSKVGAAGLAGAAGYALGGTGAGIGSAIGGIAGNALGSIGGIAGSFLGPIGMVLGPIVGGFIGKGIEKLFATEGKDELSLAKERLAKSMKEEMELRETNAQMEKAFIARRKADDIVRRASNNMLLKLEERARNSKEKEIVLSKEEAEALVKRAGDLSLFADKTKVSKDELNNLKEGSHLSADKLQALVTSSQTYEKSLSDLRIATEKILQQQLAQLEVSNLGIKKQMLQASVEQAAAEVAAGRARQSGGLGQFDSFSDEMRIYAQLGRPGSAQDAAMQMIRGSSPAFVNKIDAMIDMEKNYSELFRKEREKLSAKEKEQLDTSMKIRKAELEQIKAKNDLVKLEKDYLIEEHALKIRALVMSSDQFMTFQKDEGIKDTAKAFELYLTKKKDELINLYGESGFEMLSHKPTFMAKGGVVTRPTRAIIGEAGPEAVIPLGRSGENLVGAAVAATGGTINTVVELNVDGQRLARAIVKSAIRGRD
jgi:hypothetical protein